jgi:membrane protein DedA with SNARE-associated domain
MTEAEVAPSRFVDRVPLWWIVAPLVVLTGATFVADIVWPVLAHVHPLVLMVISSRSRHLILVAPFVSVVPFVTIGVARLLVCDAFAFALGQRFGDRAIEYLVRKAGRRAHHVERAVRLTRRAAPAVVLLMSGNLMCIVVAATGMRMRRFLLLDAFGTTVGVLMTWFVGGSLATPITKGLGWVARHPWPVVGGMLAAVVLVGAWRWHRRGDHETLHEVLEDLEQLDRETGHAHEVA